MTIWRKLWKMGWLICAVQRRCALCWTFAIAQEMPFNLSTYPETEQEYEMRRKHLSWRNGYSWEILLVFLNLLLNLFHLFAFLKRNPVANITFHFAPLSISIAINQPWPFGKKEKKDNGETWGQFKKLLLEFSKTIKLYIKYI